MFIINKQNKNTEKTAGQDCQFHSWFKSYLFKPGKAIENYTYIGDLWSKISGSITLFFSGVVLNATQSLHGKAVLYCVNTCTQNVKEVKLTKTPL